MPGILWLLVFLYVCAFAHRPPLAHSCEARRYFSTLSASLTPTAEFTKRSRTIDRFAVSLHNDFLPYRYSVRYTEEEIITFGFKWASKRNIFRHRSVSIDPISMFSLVCIHILGILTRITTSILKNFQWDVALWRVYVTSGLKCYFLINWKNVLPEMMLYQKCLKSSRKVKCLD